MTASGRRGRCAVGLLTWNGERDAPACACALLAQSEPNLEICWIDNASRDATIARVKGEAPAMPEPQVMERNLGFCGGHNRAFAATEAPYYLALNQDAALAPDYVERLADWMDAEPRLAIASGLILKAKNGLENLDPEAQVYSAGMAMGRGRFPFELGMGKAPRSEDRERRFVPAVTGAAIMIRREAALEIAGREGELFPEEFFAYFEEVDLALRVARAGMLAGVEGKALAWHAARGSEGASERWLRAHYLKNHWLMSLSNDAWSEIARELPAIVRGELVHYLPRYCASPVAALRAVALALGGWPAARRSYRLFSARYPEARARRREFFDASREVLRALDRKKR